MPTIHLGVYLTSGKETYQAVKWALEVCISCSCNALVVCMVLMPGRLDIEGTVTMVSSPFAKPLTMMHSVDSAEMYRNERESGKAILDYLSSEANAEGLKREDIHFTSKLASNGSYDAARKAIKRSVKECGVGYIDLFLLHSPYGGKQARLDSWRAVEDAIEDGEVGEPPWTDCT
jgi:hypothetical protein